MLYVRLVRADAPGCSFEEFVADEPCLCYTAAAACARERLRNRTKAKLFAIACSMSRGSFACPRE